MNTLDIQKYYDKVLGAWIGKSAGGIIGAKQENNKSLMHYNFENVFPEKYPPNDDFDLQVLYLFEVLEKNGPNFNETTIAEAFAKYNLCWANEYRVAIHNVNCGIYPPTSGLFGNSYFKNSMGCPIRSEIWAIVAPGNPELARRYAAMDGCVDHGSESIECEKFLAGLEAEAFFESDFRTLLDHALEAADRESELYACIRYVLELRETVSDWKEARSRLVANFGSCDASYSVINTGITVLALLYGDGDFEKTMLTAVNCGYDTDCTSATAGALMGIMRGKEGIPDSWLEKIGNEFYAGTVNVDRSRNTYEEVARLAVSVGVSFSRNGINDAVEFAGAPEKLWFEIPEPAARPMFGFRYDTEPAVSPEQNCLARVRIEKAKYLDLGSFALHAPADLIAEAGEMKIENGVAEIPVHIKAAAGAALPERNLIDVSCRSVNGEEVKAHFGVIGAPKYRLYGPFFDNYDTQKYDHDIYDSRMQRDPNGNLDLFAMFNGFVNINRQYIDESFGDLDSLPYREFWCADIKIDVEKQIRYKGPCCVYLVRDFVCEEDETVLILLGNNDQYKIWLNNELVAEWNEPVYYMHQNNCIMVKLKKGKNRIVYKLVRKNAKFEFSAMCSQMEPERGVFVAKREAEQRERA